MDEYRLCYLEYRVYSVESHPKRGQGMPTMPLHPQPRQRMVPIGVDFDSAEWDDGSVDDGMVTETRISNGDSNDNGDNIAVVTDDTIREAYEGSLRNYIEVTGYDGSQPCIDDIVFVGERIALGKVYVRSYMPSPRYSYPYERTHKNRLGQYGALLPTWLVGIIPPQHGISGVIASATIVGAMANTRAVTLGQVSCDISKQVTLVGFNHTEWERIESWGLRSCMVAHASIIRTACMIGLGLPQGYEGVINAPWEFFPCDYLIRGNKKIALAYCDALVLFCGMGANKRLHKRQFDSLHACYMMYVAGASIESCLSRFIRQIAPNALPLNGIMRTIYDFNGDSVVLENALSHMARLLEAFTYCFWYSQITARARSRLHMRKAYANNV